MPNKQIKIALICSPGGHMEQMLNLNEFYENYQHFWITHNSIQAESALKNENKYYLGPAHFKRPWTYLPHIPKCYQIFRSHKPTHAISTGSGRVSLVPFLVSKLFGVKFIYIDSFSRVKNFTVFATFLNNIGHPIFTQWKNDTEKKVTYLGPVFKENSLNATINSQGKHILVTTGTRHEPFERLIKSVEYLVKEGVIDEKVVVQAGAARIQSKFLEIFDYCSVEKIDELLSNAKFVITQESAGIVTKCLKLKKKFIVMPRNYTYGELPAKSDMQEDLHYKLEELGYTQVVNNTSDLTDAIRNLKNFKTGFQFDNSFAIKNLKDMVEK